MKIRETKLEAKNILKGNVWGLLAGCIIVGLISTLFKKLPNILGISTTTKEYILLYGRSYSYETTTMFGNIWAFISIIASSILNFGLVAFFIEFVRNKKVEIETIFTAIKRNFKTLILVSILTNIFVTLGLWFLIVPGIIIGLGLAFTNYVLYDNPDLKALDVIKKTWDMMNGYKWKFFLLGLSFMGWILLSILIFPLIYVVPFMNVSNVIFYEKIKSVE